VKVLDEYVMLPIKH